MTTYKKNNLKLKQAKFNINQVLKNEDNNFDYYEESKLIKARKLVNKVIRHRKKQKKIISNHYYIILSVDNFSKNYDKRSQIFNILEKEPRGWNVPYETAKENYFAIMNDSLATSFSITEARKLVKHLKENGNYPQIIPVQAFQQKYNKLLN